MIIWNTIGIALRAILRNKFRSFLTALGIVIGVAAVISMVHLGAGATASVTQEISSLGQNLLIVSPGTQRRGPGGTRTPSKSFDDADVAAIRRDIYEIAVAPVVAHQITAVNGNTNWPTTVTGTTDEYLKIREWEIADGRSFEAHEFAAGSRVCLLGRTVAVELFGDAKPVGESLRIDKISCAVIGVFAEKGQSSMGNDQDDLIVMPLRTVQRRLLGSTDIGQILVSVDQAGSLDRVVSELTALLRERRRIAVGATADFEVRDMREIVQMVKKSTETLTTLLGAIAAVSLLVGGIGIMNIMLVSVTERTREIGIRLALGARGREVLLQFLIEAGVLSTLGGIIGVVVGLGGSALLAAQLKLPTVFVPEIVIIAFLFSTLVGVLFGFLPARRASLLNPIEALRHE